jgi:hypothetical protein
MTYETQGTEHIAVAYDVPDGRDTPNRRIWLIVRNDGHPTVIATALGESIAKRIARAMTEESADLRRYAEAV